MKIGTELGRYRIERSLGSGGMGSVYAAYDTILRRDVALKVLRYEDENASPEFKARLLREARAAAALRHPNAVAVYDIGEADGMSFIAMEIVEGRSMRAALRAGGATTREKLDWLLAIARVLDAAHARGLIHRDIKPDNVMIADDGTVKVLDFGIAKFASATDLPSTEREIDAQDDEPPSFKTREGFVFGTPHYMAPEQRQGKDLDGRADQYAWGIVALETLCGRVHPKHGEVRVREALESAKNDDGVPDEVIAAIARALSPLRDSRFPAMAEIVACFDTAVPRPITPSNPQPVDSDTVDETRSEKKTVILGANRGEEATLGEARATEIDDEKSQALAPSAAPIGAKDASSVRPPKTSRWIAGVVSIGIVSGSAAAYIHLRSTPTPSATIPASILDADVRSPLRLAVLPFDAAGSEPGFEYFVEAASEELIGELAHEPQLRVIAYASVRPYRTLRKPLAEIGRELDVGTVVTGTLHIAKGEARLQVEVIDVATQVARTTHTYSMKIDDASASIRLAARELAGDLGIASQTSRSAEETTSAGARDAYRRGRHLWNQRTEEALQKAVGYFEEATRLDPSYAAAWAAIADAHLVLPSVSATPVSNAVANAKPALDKALALDPMLARAHSANATILEYAWDYPAAEKAHARAIELDPNDAVAHQWYAEMLLVQRNVDDAVMHMKRALEIDPLSAPLHRNYGMVLLYGRRHDEAEIVLQKTLELDPAQPFAHLYLAYTSIERGKPDEGLDRLHANPMLQAPAMKPFLEANELYAHAKAGRKAKAEQLLADVEKTGLDGVTTAFLYACVGRPEKMYPAMDKAIAAHERLAPFFNVIHPFDPYRDDPRFVERLKRIGVVR